MGDRWWYTIQVNGNDKNYDEFQFLKIRFMFYLLVLNVYNARNYTIMYIKPLVPKVYIKYS